MTELTVKALQDAVEGNWNLEDFRLSDWTSAEPKYGYKKPIFLQEDGSQDDYLSWYRVKKDENGFPVIASWQDEEITSEYDIYVEDFTYEGGFVPGLGLFKMIDNGNLGDGHDAWALVQHESGRLFRIGGFYSSWDSGEWNDFVEVEPAEVKVVRYRQVDKPERIFDNPAVTV